jgi:hypothetical protein
MGAGSKELMGSTVDQLMSNYLHYSIRGVQQVD